MARSTYRVLKRRGQLTLVETANPGTGVGYAVRNGGRGVWRGDNLPEAEAEFERAASSQNNARDE